jgi:hypothetical protein
MKFNDICWLYQPTPVIFNVLESTQTRIFERVIKNASESKTFIKLSSQLLLVIVNFINMLRF